MKGKRAALYLRVSTGEQTTDNQRQALEAVAAQRGWQIVATYDDAGISGSKGRDKRPGLDAALKDAARGHYDVLCAWSVDRLGRSLLDLISGLQDLHAARVDLFLHQQALDTTTPAGRAMFGMMGVFAEFERSMIVARVNAGLARARVTGTKSGKAIGRPRTNRKVEQLIRQRLTDGAGILRVAAELHVGSGTVQRVKRETTAGSGASPIAEGSSRGPVLR
jgi:DNA invertase Pin-like site-specific DNA recombinase